VPANAGTAGKSRKLDASDIVLWREAIEVNLIDAYNTVHAAVPHLCKRCAGKIVVTGLGACHRTTPRLSAYGSSKIALLMMMTRVSAVELQEFNISVNELIQGPVKTAITSGPIPLSAPVMTALFPSRFIAVLASLLGHSQLPLCPSSKVSIFEAQVRFAAPAP
jgi:NAD(P)-dependent dehydrogenase (short-subunit alcohol dehydrogenase family)